MHLRRMDFKAPLATRWPDPRPSPVPAPVAAPPSPSAALASALAAPVAAPAPARPVTRWGGSMIERVDGVQRGCSACGKRAV
jgi:hypothetical protein